ncbi:Zn-dependent protease with chaperone function [Paramagnetospirillum magnetotacticum MS-1]|uniref:Zn-dependent protease with chaperone function n=1 Tax=Paramagnetospirillum magnetotacticum MS-1 TaxID=272627 RepID=A0A0C2YXT5_PARME|nr:M48 family metalloprotease [Paramagnetospirillum magnetotacticum]KIL99500.1 Zn-dependent protease with chaperone function [Paramagnetospirillum magnetotacticum MS-1]
MAETLEFAAALASVIGGGLELVLARRALIWLGQRSEGRVQALESARVRLAAGRALGLAALALAVALGGARHIAEICGPILVLPAVLVLRTVLDLPFAAWGWLVAGRWSLAGFCREQARRLGRELAAMLPLAALTGAAVELGGGWLAAWVGLALALLWREWVPAAGRCLSAAPSPLAGLSHLEGVTVWLSDEGRRSGQLNARAEGIGRQRRIILNDTLVEALPLDEVTAVLAHEEGHLVHRHRERLLLWRLGLGLAALWIAAPDGVGLAVLLAALPMLILPVRPLEALLIRRWEGQADSHAADKAGAPAFMRALERLYGANATAPAPEPLWALWHHPHPSPSARLAELGRYSTKVGIAAAARPGAG